MAQPSKVIRCQGVTRDEARRNAAKRSRHSDDLASVEAGIRSFRLSGLLKKLRGVARVEAEEDSGQ
jgi:hypothetical protein